MSERLNFLYLLTELIAGLLSNADWKVFDAHEEIRRQMRGGYCWT